MGKFKTYSRQDRDSKRRWEKLGERRDAKTTTQQPERLDESLFETILKSSFIWR